MIKKRKYYKKTLILPPLYSLLFKIEFIKAFTETMDKEERDFAYLKIKFIYLSNGKIKEDVFVRSEIRKLLKNGQFEKILNEKDLKT